MKREKNGHKERGKKENIIIQNEKKIEVKM